MKVGTITKRITSKIEMYLPKIICHLLSGLVCKISNVPVLNSSDKERIVIAGTKKTRIQGANSKNVSNVAYPKSKRLLSFNTNKKRPFTTRNKMMAM